MATGWGGCPYFVGGAGGADGAGWGFIATPESAADFDPPDPPDPALADFFASPPANITAAAARRTTALIASGTASFMRDSVRAGAAEAARAPELDAVRMVTLGRLAMATAVCRPGVRRVAGLMWGCVGGEGAATGGGGSGGATAAAQASQSIFWSLPLEFGAMNGASECCNRLPHASQ